MNFEGRVIKEINEEIQLTHDFAKFLFLLLQRERNDHEGKLNERGDQEEPLNPDLYAYYILEALRKAPDLFHGGFTAPLRGFVDIPHKLEQLEFSPSYSFTEDLSQYVVNVGFKHGLRKEHVFVLGGTGSGKTQLIQQFITQDLKTNASIIVIDSQGDLINNLKRSKLIDPERLVIVDPEDSVEHPLALNVFDIGGGSHLKPADYERRINEAVEQLNFIFSSLGFELTPKQQIPFNYCIRLLLLIPNSTLHTFMDLLDNGIKEEHWRYINKLTPSAQRFFNTTFYKSTFNSTKAEITSRLHLLMSSPTISRIFQSPVNKFNIGKEMDSGKVVLISTDHSLLKSTGCAFFGRFFISQVAMAMQDRMNRPRHHRRKCYFYIDECQDYFDTEDKNISDLLRKGRKYNVGTLMATQELRSIPDGVLHSIMTNTAIKFVGSCSQGDASKMKYEMKTDGIYMKPLRFLAHTKGADAPFVIKVNAGLLERSGQRANWELNEIMDGNRAKYSFKPESKPEPEPHQAQVTETQPKSQKIDERKDELFEDVESFNKG